MVYRDQTPTSTHSRKRPCSISSAGVPNVWTNPLTQFVINVTLLRVLEGLIMKIIFWVLSWPPPFSVRGR
jgi:hypothetical protein